MGVPVEKINAVYLAKGETEFAVPFGFLENNSIKVFISPVNSGEKIEQSDNDFFIRDNYVVFREVLPVGTKVFIERQTDISNDTEFLNNTKLPAGTLNYALNKLTMICQELSDKLSKALIYDGEDFTGSFISKEFRKYSRKTKHYC